MGNTPEISKPVPVSPMAYQFVPMPVETPHYYPEQTNVSPTKTRHWVLVLTLVLTAVSYLDRVCISMSAPFIQDDLHLTDKQLGIVFGVFTFAYAALEMSAGWLADRFGPRLMLTRVVVWWSIMTALTGWVGGFASLLAIRFLLGSARQEPFPEFLASIRAGNQCGRTGTRLDLP